MEIVLTEENFEQEVVQSELPVLVDFWAVWCGPCMRLGPIVEEFAKEQEGKVKVGKVNVDEQMALAMQFGITSIPTLLVFKGGKIVNSSLGLVPKEKLEELVK